MDAYDLAYIERMYRAWARIYDRFTPMYLLGAECRLRQKTIAALRLQPGQAVLDSACGTGRNFPLILEKIGPRGRLVGVDYTSAMLERACQRVNREGWTNVKLIQADAASIDLKQKFDAALCTLAIGVIPDSRGALERMAAHIKPGGWVAISDGKRSTRRYARPFNWMADVLGYGAGEILTRRPWEAMPELVSGYQFEDFAWGFFYVAWGRAR